MCVPEKLSLRRASKIYGHKAFQITDLHTTVISSGHATQLTTAHTLALRCGALTAATVLADASVTPPSPK